MSRSRRGLYELNVDSLELRLYNKNLASTKIAERTWGTYDVAALESIRKLETWAAPFLIVSGLALLFWAMTQAGGLGPMLARPSSFQSSAEFFQFFVPSLTAMVGFWATLALNIPDLSRFARGQKEHRCWDNRWGFLLPWLSILSSE